ncbi:MAG: DUF4424 family protein [Tabrizicola sp.]
MLDRTFVLAGAVCLLALPTAANDGFGGLSATGLTFSETEAVAMEEENLFIGLDRIAVDYVFRNITDKDVTGEVIFPLPPVPIWSDYDWNLPEDRNRPNFVNFTAVVDGVEVPVSVDRIAVIEPPWEDGRPLAEQYDTPGRDVTADLERLGIPLTLDGDAVVSALTALDEAGRAEVQSLELADYDSLAAGIYPKWSIVLRYHWTQTFPAGKTVKISHEYENYPYGGLFGWSDPPDEYEADLAKQYCVDPGTSRAMEKALTFTGDDGEVHSAGYAYYTDYVLRTANSWAGPIGKFTLTLDKGDPKNVISLCADGVKKTGPTTFVVEKTNYTPDRDLEILIVQPVPRE